MVTPGISAASAPGRRRRNGIGQYRTLLPRGERRCQGLVDDVEVVVTQTVGPSSVLERPVRLFFACRTWAIPSGLSGLDVERPHALVMSVVGIPACLPLDKVIDQSAGLLEIRALGVVGEVEQTLQVRAALRSEFEGDPAKASAQLLHMVGALLGHEVGREDGARDKDVLPHVQQDQRPPDLLPGKDAKEYGASIPAELVQREGIVEEMAGLLHRIHPALK